MSGWVAGAIIVGAAISAYSSKRASEKSAEAMENAAKLQAEAQEEGLEWQKEIYRDYRPFLMRGLQGYEDLLKDPESVRKTPGYLFRLQEGLKSIGIPDGGSRFLSGAQIKSAIRYGQDYGASEYDRALMRQATLAGVAQGNIQTGATVGQGISQTLMSGANIQGQYLTNAANARASGYIGASNAFNQGISNYLMYQNMQQGGSAASYYGAGQTSGYGSNVAGDAYAPAYGG